MDTGVVFTYEYRSFPINNFRWLLEFPKNGKTYSITGEAATLRHCYKKAFRAYKKYKRLQRKIERLNK